MKGEGTNELWNEETAMFWRSEPFFEEMPHCAIVNTEDEGNQYDCF